ncbi:MAG: nitroreductase family protein, partial [Bacteroidales bacterium]|nr:nitroreductase family protein [Bacteroidales bacterium]
SAATQNILLAAHAMGLGAVWCGVSPIKERVQATSQILKLPSFVKPLCVIAVGHPAENPQPKDKWKPENVHRNAAW